MCMFWWAIFHEGFQVFFTSAFSVPLCLPLVASSLQGVLWQVLAVVPRACIFIPGLCCVASSLRLCKIVTALRGCSSSVIDIPVRLLTPFCLAMYQFYTISASSGGASSAQQWQPCEVHDCTSHCWLPFPVRLMLDSGAGLKRLVMCYTAVGLFCGCGTPEYHVNCLVASIWFLQLYLGNASALHCLYTLPLMSTAGNLACTVFKPLNTESCYYDSHSVQMSG